MSPEFDIFLNDDETKLLNETSEAEADDVLTAIVNTNQLAFPTLPEKIGQIDDQSLIHAVLYKTIQLIDANPTKIDTTFAKGQKGTDPNLTLILKCDAQQYINLSYEARNKTQLSFSITYRNPMYKSFIETKYYDLRASKREGRVTATLWKYEDCDPLPVSPLSQQLLFLGLRWFAANLLLWNEKEFVFPEQLLYMKPKLEATHK